jgi:hypothetical protein
MPQPPRQRPDRRRRLDAQAPAAPSWRCGGRSGQRCNPASQPAADQLAQAKNGAPGVAGVPCAALAASGRAALLAPRRPARVTRP